MNQGEHSSQHQGVFGIFGSGPEDEHLDRINALAPGEPSLTRSTAPSISRPGTKPPVLGLSQLASGEAEDGGITDITSIILAGKKRAVTEANTKKRTKKGAFAAEKAKLKEIEALDLVMLEFNGKEVTVGKERHRLCDPLFDPRVLKHVPVLDARFFGHNEKEKEQNPVLSVAAWRVLSSTS